MESVGTVAEGPDYVIFVPASFTANQIISKNFTVRNRYMFVTFVDVMQIQEIK